MNTLIRIKEFIDKKGLSISAFEKSIGISNGAFASQLKNNKTIGVDKLENILNIYSELNPSWLLTGEGEMLKSNVVPVIIANVEEPQTYLAKRRTMKNTNAIIKKEKEYQGVPIYNVPIDASFLERFRDETYYEPIGFLNLPKLRNCDFAAVVSGNSMYPLMKSGSIIFCRIVNANLNTDTGYFDEGEMYFVSTVNGFETVKYVQSGDNIDELLLIPHNEKIRPTIIKKSNVLRMCIVEAWLNYR